MPQSIYYSSYIVRVPKLYFVRDKPVNTIYSSSQNKNSDHAELLFHVSQDDYFSTLASILRFYEESINNKNITPDMRELQLKTIKDVMNDLLYLNKNYTIAPKDK